MNGCALLIITRKYDLRTDHRRLPAGSVPLRSRGHPAGQVLATRSIYPPGVGEGWRIFDVRPCGKQMLHFRQLTQERQTFWQPGSSTGPGCFLCLKHGASTKTPASFSTSSRVRVRFLAANRAPISLFCEVQVLAKSGKLRVNCV